MLTGAAAGTINGVLVNWLGLPSLVVTLGALAMFRGIGYIILGSGSVNEFPDGFTDFGINAIGQTPLPLDDRAVPSTRPDLCGCPATQFYRPAHLCDRRQP